MRTFRATVRLTAIVLLTLGMFVIYMTGVLLTVPFPRARLRWRWFMVPLWARILLAIMGVRLTVQGTLPRPPFCLVTNHLGYLDILLLHSRLRCVILAKADVRSWPIFGTMAHLIGTLFIDRSKSRDLLRVSERIQGHLEQGDGVIFFPEGTSSKGEKVLPFKTSLLDPMARMPFPVSYASISYSTPPGEPPASTAVCWWGDMTFGDHVFNLLKLPSVKAFVTYGEDTILDLDRKSLALRLKQQVEQNFIPVGTNP